MRTRSPERRDAILHAAVQVFLSTGFERASMEEIARQTPCSKVTLYSYFQSKEHLFFDAIVRKLDEQFLGLFSLLDGNSPTRDVLLRFGNELVALLCTPEVRSMRRLVIATTGKLGEKVQQKWHESGPGAASSSLASFFDLAERRGELRVPDKRIAALHLRALLEAEWTDLLFYDLSKEVSRKSMQASAAVAVDSFMLLYGAPER